MSAPLVGDLPPAHPDASLPDAYVTVYDRKPRVGAAYENGDVAMRIAKAAGGSAADGRAVRFVPYERAHAAMVAGDALMAELYEQLARVTRERDDYRRLCEEVINASKVRVDSQQECPETGTPAGR